MSFVQVFTKRSLCCWTSTAFTPASFRSSTFASPPSTVLLTIWWATDWIRWMAKYFFLLFKLETELPTPPGSSRPDGLLKTEIRKLVNRRREVKEWMSRERVGTDKYKQVEERRRGRKSQTKQARRQGGGSTDRRDFEGRIIKFFRKFSKKNRCEFFKIFLWKNCVLFIYFLIQRGNDPGEN